MNTQYQCEHPIVRMIQVPVSGTKTFWKDGLRKGSFYETYSKIPMQLPCGECTACRLRTQRLWQSRITMEMLHQDNLLGYTPFYVTLTFGDSITMPRFNREGTATHFVTAADWNSAESHEAYRKYVKKRLFDNLRAKKGAGLDFRYYVCQEYGDEHGRSHFHALLFVKNCYDIPLIDGITYHRLIHNSQRNVRGRDGFDRLQTPLEASFQALIEKFWSIPKDGRYITRKSRKLVKNGRNRQMVSDNATPIGNVEQVQICDLGTAEYITKYVSPLTEDKEVDKKPFHRQSQGLGYMRVVNALRYAFGGYDRHSRSYKEWSYYCNEKEHNGAINYLKSFLDDRYIIVKSNKRGEPIKTPLFPYYIRIIRERFGVYLKHCQDIAKTAYLKTCMATGKSRIEIKRKNSIFVFDKELQQLLITKTPWSYDNQLECNGYYTSIAEGQKYPKDVWSGAAADFQI